MASGSSGRNNPNSKGFDFASSDDILCSYEDYDNNQDTSNGNHSDPPSLTSNSTKEFHKSRMVRSSMFPASSPQEESFSQDVIITVEKTMKKHTDNLMRFLEGISSRLSQLELYCYNLDKSIGEMRSDLVRDHGEADSKLRSVEKHLQEVHRSVQILRDKQELADTQKELAKMQLAQKDSSSSASEDKTSVPSTDQKSAADNTSDGHGQELALVLPNQVTPQGPLSTRPVVQQQTVAPAPPQAVTQPQAYYVPPSAQMQNQQAPPQPQSAQNPYLPADAQYRTPQMQEISRDSSQAPHLHQSPQYQQHWPQQPPQMRPQSSPRPYPPYQSQQEPQPNSLSMQVPYSGISQQGPSRAEPMPYGYGGLSQTPQQPQPQPQPSQHLKINFGAQPSAGYSGPANPYVMYEGEGGGQRNHPQQSHFPHGGYAPSSVPQPNAGNHMVRPPQFGRGNPYGELIEKMVSMGYRGDHVASVIQRLEETGQPIDFNSVLDKLNGLSSGGGQRGWSG